MEGDLLPPGDRRTECAAYNIIFRGRRMYMSQTPLGQ